MQARQAAALAGGKRGAHLAGLVWQLIDVLGFPWPWQAAGLARPAAALLVGGLQALGALSTRWVVVQRLTTICGVKGQFCT